MSSTVTSSRRTAHTNIIPLWWQFTLRTVELRHKGSYLGWIWSVLQPLAMLALYVFVFGHIFGGRFNSDNVPGQRWDYALGIFVGLSLFHLLAEVVGVAPTTIVSQPNFVKKIVFPLEILPGAALGAAGIHYLITTGLMLVAIVALGSGVGLTWLWWPLISLPFLMLTCGAAFLLSAVGVFFRDVTQLTSFLVPALMFASAVFYPAAKVAEESPWLWQFLRFNPLLQAIELSREVLLWHQHPAWGPLLYLWLCGAGVLGLGWRAFRRMKPSFADVI